MTIHPAPPQDLAGLIAGYRQTVQSVIDLGQGLSPEDFAKPTACPGWDLQDHFSHIAAVEHFLETGDNPEHDVSGLDHVRHEFGVWMEQGVQERRSREGAEVVQELQALLEARLATLSDPELTLETQVRGPLGSTRSLRGMLMLRLQDIWVHEQDIREVLGRMGNLDSPAAATFVMGLVRFFPNLIESVEMAEGQTVILESTGPVTARVGVRAARGEDGELTLHSLFTGESESGMGAAVHSEDDPTTTIALSTHALTRRGAGRTQTSATAYSVVGDEELALRVLDALTMTP